MCHNWIRPVRVRMPSAIAWHIIVNCVNSSSLRFGKRSAITPPNRPSSSTGSAWSIVTLPSASGESVSFSTSQAWAIDCIQEPVFETTWPNQNRRKSRWWSARNVCPSRSLSVGRAVVVTSANTHRLPSLLLIPIDGRGLAQHFERPRDPIEVCAKAARDLAHIPAHLVRELAEQRSTGVGEAQRRLAAVVGEAAACHQRMVHQLDDQATGRGDRDAELSRELAGRGARVAAQVVQHPQLRQRHMRAFPLTQAYRVGDEEGAPEGAAESGIRCIIHTRMIRYCRTIEQRRTIWCRRTTPPPTGPCPVAGDATVSAAPCGTGRETPLMN